MCASLTIKKSTVAIKTQSISKGDLKPRPKERLDSRLLQRQKCRCFVHLRIVTDGATTLIHCAHAKLQ